MDEEPPRLLGGEPYTDVWKAVQTEMVSLGLPLLTTFPAIVSAYMLYAGVHEKAALVEKLALESRLGRFGRSMEDQEYVKQETDYLHTRIDAAEANGNQALDDLTTYWKELGGDGD